MNRMQNSLTMRCGLVSRSFGAISANFVGESCEKFLNERLRYVAQQPTMKSKQLTQKLRISCKSAGSNPGFYTLILKNLKWIPQAANFDR